MVGTILSTSYSRELYENSVKMTTKAALYRHAWKHALICKDFTSFISTNDKNKVKCSEPGSPTSTVTWAERVLVAKNRTVSCICIKIALVIHLLFKMLLNLKNCYYNSMKTENIPPILIIYTYWDPEPDIAD